MTILFASLQCLSLTAGAAADSVSVDEAVERAIAENPSIRAMRAELGAAGASVSAAIGARGPLLSVSASGRHDEGLTAAANGIATQQQDELASNAALSVQTDIGTTLSVGVATAVAWRATNLDPTQTTVFRIGPTYSGALTLGVRQPLLRGAGHDVALGPQMEAEALEGAATRALQQSVSELAFEVTVAHRELWYAQQALEVRDSALSLAERQHAEAQLRLTVVQTLSRVDVLRYASQLASAQAAHADASAEVRARRSELARLMGLTRDQSKNLRADSPSGRSVVTSPAALLTRAANEHSPELLRLEAQLAAARVRRRTAADADQARVDLVGQVGASVLFDNGSLRDLALPADRPAYSAMLGVELELPIGSTSQQAAERAQAAAEEAAAEARYDAAKQRISAQIASQRGRLLAAARRVGLSASTAKVASTLAEAERERAALGSATPMEVLQAQQDEYAARLNHIRARADYALSEAEIAHLTGALTPTATGARP